MPPAHGSQVLDQGLLAAARRLDALLKTLELLLLLILARPGHPLPWAPCRPGRGRGRPRCWRIRRLNTMRLVLGKKLRQKDVDHAAPSNER